MKSRITRFRQSLDNQFARDDFVATKLASLPPGSLILDAGCGSQRYRPLCAHLEYRGQDFGQFSRDEVASFTDRLGGDSGYAYGDLDYLGDVWAIDEADQTFDAILCTEVLEHIPYPIRTIEEFFRLLKPGGLLILTAPSNSLRHMDPYYFYSGFSDRWYERVLDEAGFSAIEIAPVEDYYRWVAVEIARTAKANSLAAKILLAPSFGYYFFKKRTNESQASLCMGYHVVARRS